MDEQETRGVKRIRRRRRAKKIAKILLLSILLLLLIIYIIIGVIYNSGSFTISLDRNLYFDRGLIIYERPDYKVYRSELFAKSVDYFDNISYKWLPENLESQDGSHNGDNYVAYTFYIENTGVNVTDYWYEVNVSDVLKNVDEAVRIRLYKNGQFVTYAKISKRGQPEPNTTVFETDSLVIREHEDGFKPGGIDKFTIVIWLEGSDPECTDNILGGEIKVNMDFKSEIVD